ncbi:hypothetical protein ACQ4PT_069327 [Festuca glaucescens]
MELGTGLRIIDCDRDTMSMIAVVLKFQYFQLFVHHSDMDFDTGNIDDVVISGSPVLPAVLSPKCRRYEGEQHQKSGQEPRRSRRNLMEEDVENCSANGDSDSDDTDCDQDWVDSDNEVAEDDDDLYEEWVDDKGENQRRSKSKMEQDSDYDTEDLEELEGSDVEEEKSGDEVVIVDKQGRKKTKKKVKVTRWRPENNKGVEFKIGMVFMSVKELRAAIQEYILQNRVGVHYLKNDLQRIRCRCEDGCPWFLYAAPDSRHEAFVVKKYVGKHDCERDWVVNQFTAKYLASHYLEKFRADDKMSLKNFAMIIQQDFNMSASRSKLERARRFALTQINGDELAQYNLLWDFAAEIRRSNPGSTMFVNAKAGLFENCYMSLDACKRGLLAGCRPVIGIDGCHMKNRFGGVMLAAVGVDPNDCIFPIALAIVEVEDTDSWKWFLNTLKEDLAIENTRPWTIISDRQKGLINVVNALWPDAAHRFCVRHLHQNFAKHWRGDIFKNKLWQIARATREVDWKQYMDEMKALDQDAYEYLEGIDPKQWCKAFFDDLPKCDLLLNNICEVFNKYILDAREMPVVTCLKKIMNQLMIRFVSKRKETEDMCGTICPKIRKKLDKNIDFAVNYGASPAAEQLFKVEGLRGEYEVNIQKLECTCRAWQLSGIPCRHACAVFRHERSKPESVVHKCYSIDAFKAAYGQVIMPCSDPKVWPKMNGPAMRPPKFDKQVGMPSKKRRRSALEEEDGTRMSRHGIVGHCSICNSTEHNKRKCPRCGEYATAQEEHAAPAQEEHAAPAQKDIVPVHVEPQPQPIQVVLADEELQMQAQPPQKMAVKRNNAAKKKTLPVQKTSAGASIVQSVMSYDISESTSVINILQEQALATQQSQTPVPGPLPQSQFIARCRDDLPPRRPATLGLKRKKPLPKKKKENMLPNV